MRDGVEFRLRLFECHAGAQPTDDCIMVLGSDRALAICHCEWRPKLGSKGRIRTDWELKLCPHDPDHAILGAVEIDVLPNDVGIGSKLSPPEGFTENDNVVVPWLVLFWNKDSAQQRLGLKHGKEIRRNTACAD